jgi:alpha-ketoglutarate-dependent taurine dioxygenase
MRCQTGPKSPSLLEFHPKEPRTDRIVDATAPRKKREKKWLTSLPFEKTPPEKESQKS